MSMYLFFVVLTIVTVGLALPTGRNLTIYNTFVHPSLRSNVIIDGRIIGGREAQPHAYPYQVGLYCRKTSGTNFCGGSLVSPNYVLTAAHCADGMLSIDLIFGAHAIEQNEITQIRQTSDQFIVHPGWDKDRLINDIALIKLSTPVQETNYIKIIRITGDGGNFAGKQGTITGWGRMTNTQPGVTPVLMYASSDILSNDACKNIDPYDTVIQPTHLCLSGVANSNNVGTCNGDSGGPLAVDGIQVGLVSFGYSDCEVGKPSVFTRLTEFRDWIRQNSDVTV